MNTLINESLLDARVKRAREFAQRIATGQVDGDLELEFFFRSRLSMFYRIPIFDSYFKDLTLDQLVFECELIRLLQQDGEKQGSEALSENKEEASAMFDDWAEGDQKEWVDQSVTPDMTDGEFDQEAARFMKTGKFKGEE